MEQDSTPYLQRQPSYLTPSAPMYMNRLKSKRNINSGKSLYEEDDKFYQNVSL